VLREAGLALALSTHDQAAFVDALLAPPAPAARLRAASRRYQTRMAGQGKRTKTG